MGHLRASYTSYITLVTQMNHLYPVTSFKVVEILLFPRQGRKYGDPKKMRTIYLPDSTVDSQPRCALPRQNLSCLSIYILFLVISLMLCYYVSSTKLIPPFFNHPSGGFTIIVLHFSWGIKNNNFLSYFRGQVPR